MRGVTYNEDNYSTFYNISTHTPHARRDVHFTKFLCTHIKFQLTRLMRGVTLQNLYSAVSLKFQLTRLMRGVTGGL